MVVQADPSPLSQVEVTRLVAEVQALGAAMADNRQLHSRLADRRRRILFQLNRDGGLTYRELREHTGLAWSRLIDEIRKVRIETGAERLPPGRRPGSDDD